MTDVAKRAIGYLVLGAIAAGLLVYGFGQVEQLLGFADAPTTAASAAEVARHPWRTRFRDSLAAVQRSDSLRSAGLADSADALMDSLDSISAHYRRLEAAGTPVPAADWRTVALGFQRADSQHQGAYASCRWEVTECAKRANDAQHEADSLSRQLDAQRKLRTERCGLAVGLGALAGRVYPDRGQPGLGLALGAFAGVSCTVFRLPF